MDSCSVRHTERCVHDALFGAYIASRAWYAPERREGGAARQAIWWLLCISGYLDCSYDDQADRIRKRAAAAAAHRANPY